MKRSFFACAIAMIILPFWSCSNNGSSKDLNNAENRVLQQEDGTISLKLDKAACYFDSSDPSSNTAEWNVVISKPGRFKIWLSSATTDTTDLHYENAVRINLPDNQLEVDPACDKIIANTGEISHPYFRADSYVGSFFVTEPGEYHIQVISEKVIAKNTRVQNISPIDDTMLMSVFLTPMTR